MNPIRASALALLLGFATACLQAQQGPFAPESWPSTLNKNAKVHYVSVGDNLAAPNGNWTPSLQVLSGGDQLTADIEIGGFPAKKVTGNYLNTADGDGGYAEWADKEFIDILMQVYGDAAVLNASGKPRNFNFLIGTLPELAAPSGGQIAAEGKNGLWNWVLFRIPNGLRGSDGTRFVGSIPANAQGATQNAGVNGGTIRLEAVPNLIVRAGWSCASHPAQGYSYLAVGDSFLIKALVISIIRGNDLALPGLTTYLPLTTSAGVPVMPYFAAMPDAWRILESTAKDL